MGFLLSLQNLDQREGENRDVQFVSTASTSICFSTHSAGLC